MSLQNTPKPGASLGLYPEKPNHTNHFFNKIRLALFWPLAMLGQNHISKYQAFVTQVRQEEQVLPTLSLDALQQQVHQLRVQLSMAGLTEPLMVKTFAVVVRACALALSKSPYDTQLIAARIMLDGKLAEMATGEGKTLAAGLCAASAALAGIPVHLITSNDYLVERDAETMRPLYDALGLSVGTILNGMETEPRQHAYACNITYCTAKELVFDYLRDQTAMQALRSDLHTHVANVSGKRPNTLLRGLFMAIIDEADSILIDEARVPLILSKSNLNEIQLGYFTQSILVANKLNLYDDFTVDHGAMSVQITVAGSQKIEEETKHLGALWKHSVYRKESVSQALAALHLYQKDRHYLIDDDKVQIIDEITGRVSPGRVWSRGLHQMIEIKEGCTPTGELETMSQITYQRFFPRYLRIGGMSGTLSESRGELLSTYQLLIRKVPLRKSSLRVIHPTRLFRTIQDQQSAVIHRVKTLYQQGQPVLIGTDSVADSEKLSTLFQEAGLPHEVLNARQTEQEASIISQAGHLGRITISTNMAGRGTDIALSEEVQALGGLHVICCQHNISKRIDRQLIGRSARQGDPGSAETLATLEKLLIYRKFPAWLTGKIPTHGMSKPVWLVQLLIRLPQWIESYNQKEQRRELLRQDAQTEKNLLSMGVKH